MRRAALLRRRAATPCRAASCIGVSSLVSAIGWRYRSRTCDVVWLPRSRLAPLLQGRRARTRLGGATVGAARAATASPHGPASAVWCRRSIGDIGLKVATLFGCRDRGLRRSYRGRRVRTRSGGATVGAAWAATAPRHVPASPISCRRSIDDIDLKLATLFGCRGRGLRRSYRGGGRGRGRAERL